MLLIIVLFYNGLEISVNHKQKIYSFQGYLTFVFSIFCKLPGQLQILIFPVCGENR